MCAQEVHGGLARVQEQSDSSLPKLRPVPAALSSKCLSYLWKRPLWRTGPVYQHKVRKVSLMGAAAANQAQIRQHKTQEVQSMSIAAAIRVALLPFMLGGYS